MDANKANQGATQFCKHCGEVIDADCVVCPKCGKQVQQIKGDAQVVVNNTNTNVNSNWHYPPRSKTVTLILCLFLGALGVHRFYVGKSGTGLIWLFTLGLFGVGVLVDFILILTGSFRDKAGMPLI